MGARALKERFPEAQHVAVGHSVGAHGMLATQHEEPVEAMVMVASHAGITRTIRTVAERFAKAEGPVLSMVMEDDLWAHRGAVDILTDRLDRASVIKRDIEAGEGTANGPVGHMGFYRSKHKGLWPEVAEWLEQTV